MAQTTTAAPAPGQANVYQTINGMGNLKTFASLVTQSGMSKMLSSGGPYTVFAPSDDVFNKMPPGALNNLKNNNQLLSKFMNSYIVKGRYTQNNLLDAKKVTTLDGKTLTIVPRVGYAKVDGAMITKEDLPASNGIIHVIDSPITAS